MNINFHFSGMNAQDHNCWGLMAVAFLVFKVTAKLFSRVAITFYILTNDVCFIFANIWCCHYFSFYLFC